MIRPELTIDNIDLTPGAWQDGVPHEQFRLLREQAPVHWHPEESGRGFWAITRHNDIRTISRDTATFSSERGGTLLGDQEEASLAQQRLSLINMDPPRHLRYRQIVSKAFTPRVVATLSADIERRAHAAIDTIADGGDYDFVPDIAAQVPLQTIAAMMGLPEEQWEKFFELSTALVGGSEEQSAVAAMEIFSLCAETVADRRSNPRDDLTTALIEAQVDGERLDDLEINMFFLTLLVAGNETTRNMLVHGLLVLLEHPDDLRRLRADPSLWGTAVEEILRWGCSVHSFRRTATRDVTIHNSLIREGDKVLLYYASANRDSTVFTAADSFDIHRDPNDHMTFGGGGPHHCLGVALTRLQITAVLRNLAARIDDIDLAGPVVRLESDFLDGFASVPIRVGALSSMRPPS